MTPKSMLLTVLGVGTVGGVATGGYFLLKFDNTNKISELKKQEKVSQSLREVLASKQPLDTKTATDNLIWGNLVAKYFESTTNQSKKIQIANLRASNDEVNRSANIDALKTACETLFAKTENYENDKEVAEMWCTKKSSLLESSPNSLAALTTEGTRPLPS